MGDTRAAFEAWAVERLIAYQYTTDGGCVRYAPLDASEPAAWDAWQASRKQALKEAAEEADGFGDDYMVQAREGDNSGASDHKACAAVEIADAIRSLEGNAKETT